MYVHESLNVTCCFSCSSISCPIACKQIIYCAYVKLGTEIIYGQRKSKRFILVEACTRNHFGLCFTVLFFPFDVGRRLLVGLLSKCIRFTLTLCNPANIQFSAVYNVYKITPQVNNVVKCIEICLKLICTLKIKQRL